MLTLQGCTRLLEFIAHRLALALAVHSAACIALPFPLSLSLFLTLSFFPLFPSSCSFTSLLLSALPFPASISACLPAGNMQSKSSARQTLRWHFRTHFHDAAATHTPLSFHPLSPPASLPRAGRGRSVVSPGVACHLAKAVILLLAKYKSECCAN